METDVNYLDPNGALGRIATLARKWERRARRAEAGLRARALVWFFGGAACGAGLISFLQSR
jgi:hypothetical protein